MDRIKGGIVTAGKFLTLWQDGVPTQILSKYGQVNSVKYNENCDAVYLGCSDGSVIGRSL